MLAELVRLLAAAPPDATVPEFRRCVVEGNVLAKRTAITREHTLRKLKALYGLDPAIPVYRVMRRFWDDDPEGRALLALLCAIARDPLLRDSVRLVMETPVGSVISTGQFEESVRPSYSETTRAATASHLVSTWHAAGFLSAGPTRARTRAKPTPGAATYALALGFMEGSRGTLLLTTSWARLLDCGEDVLLGLVRQAARRGWLEYRAAGDVKDIRVEDLFTDEERGWCDGQ
jgi:hypothetical protein